MASRPATVERRAAAEGRVEFAMKQLGLGTMALAIPLRVNDAIPTAAWCYNRDRKSVEIHVSPRLAVDLPMRCLEALLMHELLHHVGFNEHRYSFPPDASRELVNLSLDIALERVLSAGRYAEALVELNNLLLVADLPSEPKVLALQDALPLLCHSDPPLKRLPWPIRRLSRHYWNDVRRFISPVEIYRQLCLVAGSSGVTPTLPREVRVTNPVTGMNEVLLPRRLPVGNSIDRGMSFEEADFAAQALAMAGYGPSTLREILRQARGETPRDASESARRLLASAREAERSCDWRRECLNRLYPESVRDHVVRLPYVVRPTRAEWTRRSIGWPGVLFSNRSTAPSTVPIYVDVSSSMEDVARHVVDLLMTLKRSLPGHLHVFDTEVRRAATGDLLRGRWWTGGGTDFNAVFSHAWKQGYRQALVITDGHSSVDEQLLRRCRRRVTMRAVLFLTEFNPPTTDYWDRWVEIDPAAVAGR